VGSLVGPQSNPLVVVVRQDPVYVTFPVSQRELLDVRKRQAAGNNGELAVKLRLADGSMYGKTGKFNFLDVKVDPGTDTVAVRTEFPNPDGVLVPGQFAEIVIEEAAPEEALVIPQSALQIDQAGPFVLVVGAEKKVEPRRVEVGQSQGSRITVAKGLNEGDLVIVEGGQKVRPGQVVTASPMAAPAGT
jgi:membrane fusion protein (multidrug efflux system)